MKKILIVNNNMDMGGIQKSLVNLVKSLYEDYEITLLLFSKSGSLLAEIPKEVKIITPRKVFKVLGLSRTELKAYPLLYVLKGFLVKVAKLFSRRSAMRILGLFQKKIKGFDAVISYSHLPNHKYFANGCGDFVLDKTVCNNKICLIHCDYLQPEYSSKKNNEQYYEFSKIACCSDSVKNRFLQVSGFDENKVFTLRNFYDLTITTKTNESALEYDKQFINLVTIARLSKEKGVDRAINALYESGRQDIRYYVIGDGPQKTELLNKIKEYNLCEQVFMMGEKQNPYGFMVDADYIFVPSIHEAAPMVFDEAKVLGVPIIATETTSAREMLEEEDKIVQNSPEGLLATFAFLEKRNKGIIREINNDLQRSQFKIVLEEKENDKRICK